MKERHGCPTDVTDEQWALIEPVIAPWKAARPSATGNVSRHSMRAIVNAIQYQNRAGCSWSLLPNDLPPPWTVKYFFYQWRDDGLDQTLCELLGCRMRERAGRAEDPRLVMLDAQSVHAANNVPAATTGKEASKRVPGRNHGISVDIIGLIIAVVVVAASVHDNQVGTALLSKVAVSARSVQTALVDQGFKSSVVEGREVEHRRADRRAQSTRHRVRPATLLGGGSTRRTAPRYCSGVCPGITKAAPGRLSRGCTGRRRTS